MNYTFDRKIPGKFDDVVERVGNPALTAIATQVAQKLKQVIEAI